MPALSDLSFFSWWIFFFFLSSQKDCLFDLRCFVSKSLKETVHKSLNLGKKFNGHLKLAVVGGGKRRTLNYLWSDTVSFYGGQPVRDNAPGRTKP